MSDFRERRFTAQDGVSLYYRDYGDPAARALPVICLTGLTRNSKDYADLAPRLAVRRRVVCPDYRGRGRSGYDPDWRNYEPPTYLNDLRHLLAVTGIHRAVFIGTSLGGLFACAMSLAAPSSVAGIVMNDSGPALEQGGIDHILEYISKNRPQPDWDTAAQHLKTMFPGMALQDHGEWIRMAHNTYRPGDDGMLHFDWDVDLVKPLQRMREMPDLWPLFRGIGRIPAVAIRGEISDVLSEATFARMQVEKPDLVRVTIPGVGHAPTLNEAEAVAAIDGLLARVDAA